MSSLDDFLSTTADGSYYLGHASVLARLAGKLYAFDPHEGGVVFCDSWKFVPEQVKLPPEVLRELAGVFISHEHEDHVDPRVLSRLQCPVYIAKWRPRLREKLQALGCDVLEMLHHDWWHVGTHDEVEAYVVPSEHNDIDSSFIVRSDTYTLYHGNDNFVSAAAVARSGATADHAYVPFAYVTWYPACVSSMPAEERSRVLQERVRANMDIGLAQAAALKAVTIIPCGGNLAYLGDNEALRDAVPTPGDFAEYNSFVEDWLPGSWNNVRNGGSLAFWSTSEWRQAFTDARTTHQGPPTWEQRREWLKERLPEGVVVSVRCGSVSVLCGSEVLEAGHAPHGGPCHCAFVAFTLDPLAYHRWMAGEPFENILVSGRFTVHRVPEEYDERVWKLLREWK